MSRPAELGPGAALTVDHQPRPVPTSPRWGDRPLLARHGTIANFTRGCPCDECDAVGRAAATERTRRYRAGKATT